MNQETEATALAEGDLATIVVMIFKGDEPAVGRFTGPKAGAEALREKISESLRAAVKQRYEKTGEFAVMAYQEEYGTGELIYVIDGGEVCSLYLPADGTPACDDFIATWKHAEAKLFDAA